MTTQAIQIRSDIQRWVEEFDGIRAIRRLDVPRLQTLITEHIGPDATSTLVWRLLTTDGEDVAFINRRLRELVP